MSTESNCFFCGFKSNVESITRLSMTSHYTCEYCGKYLLDLDFRDDFQGAEDKFKMACVLNERRLKGHGGIALDDKTDEGNKVMGYPRISVDELLDGFPKKPNDFLCRALLNLSRLVKPAKPFEMVRFDMKTSKSYLHIFTETEQEGTAFLRELADQKFIRFNEARGGFQEDAFFLTIKLSEFVENLNNLTIDNKRAFVAMWFDESMDNYYKNRQPKN